MKRSNTKLLLLLTTALLSTNAVLSMDKYMKLNDVTDKNGCPTHSFTGTIGDLGKGILINPETVKPFYTTYETPQKRALRERLIQQQRAHEAQLQQRQQTLLHQTDTAIENIKSFIKKYERNQDVAALGRIRELNNRIQKLLGEMQRKNLSIHLESKLQLARIYIRHEVTQDIGEKLLKELVGHPQIQSDAQRYLDELEVAENLICLETFTE